MSFYDDDGWNFEERLRYVKAHRKQDMSLLQELWPVHDREGGVKPSIHYSETNAKIQKKFKRARATHMVYWLYLWDEQKMINELPLTDEEKAQRWISSSDKIIGLILSAVPKVDGKIVSDVSEKARSEAAGWNIDTGGISMLMYFTLVWRVDCKLRLRDWVGAIDDANEAMALLPPIIEGDKYSILHPKEIPALLCRGNAHYHSGNLSMAFNDYRCCCAAMRLVMHYKDRYDQDIIDSMMGVCDQVISKTVKSAVAIKVQQGAERPFFSVEEINLYEKELGIGIFSRQSHKCGNCDMSRTDFPNGSKTCTGCFRVSYCSKECQLEDWKIHKHSCGEKWRSMPMEAERLGLDRTLLDRKTSIVRNTGFLLLKHQLSDWFIVCCMDPKTKEPFDGWTDRPLTLEGEGSKHVASGVCECERVEDSDCRIFADIFEIGTRPFIF